MKIEWSNIKNIIEKNASSKEKDNFARWINESKANEDYFIKISGYYNNPILAEQQNSKSKKKSENSFSLIKKAKRKKLRRNLIATFSSAAVFVVALLVVYPIFQNLRLESNANKTQISNRDIMLPGGVILKAENVDINEDIISSEAINISQNSADVKEISYLKNTTKGKDINYHTIKTPIGKSFNIILSDGTKVFLNAQSELRYPTSFENSKSRTVYLKGEGYFDVVKSSAMFIVKANDVDVKVYGTKFNVNAYNKTDIKTVLLSGSVGVSLANTPSFTEKILIPNQMAIIYLTNQNVEILDVNPLDYLSWKDGIIKSYNSTLGDLTMILENWYGQKFIFIDNEIAQRPITASFRNDLRIDDIIGAIEYILNIKVTKMEGGYIIN